VLVSKFLNLALGILAAIGGFVDIGDLVFNTAAGATFGYQLLWVLPIGVVGIIVYSEMCGRVVAASARRCSTRCESALASWLASAPWSRRRSST
jgi:Mn2+/Fe2+ NRAMP family transporter